MENKTLEHLALPPLVIPVRIINGVEFQITTDNTDEYNTIFSWVDRNDIQERILRLKKITLFGEISIIEINGDSKTIIEYPRLIHHS